MGLQLEWPLGKDLKPSLRMSLSVFRQIPEVTRTQAGLKASSTTGLTANSRILLRSGSHLDRRSGRGFPKRFLAACVIKKAVATKRARPARPFSNSHSFKANSLLLLRLQE